MPYRGSCHCGGIAFEVEGELTIAVSCNCSICSRKGALLWAVPHDRLRLLTPGDGMGTYAFGRRTIEHRFCRGCGMQPYSEDAAAGPQRSAYINIRCLDGIDPASLATIEFDGRSA